MDRIGGGAIFNISEFRQRLDARAHNSVFQRPKEFAHYSLDESRCYHDDDRSIRHYYPPRVGADLSSGFRNFNEHDDSQDEHLEGLLRALMAWERRSNKKIEADIVTWRGMMTKILIALFDDNDFEMNATKFQGSIFVEEHHHYRQASRRQQTQSRSRGPSQALMSFWGYKFETISLLAKPWHLTSREEIEARESERVSNHAQYCSLVRTGVGTVSMVLAGEVDAIWSRRPKIAGSPIDWVELKTSQEITGAHDQAKLNRKLLRIWAQSFLLGVPRIIMGFRDRDGILLRIQEMSTMSIPRQASQGTNSWNGTACINFAESFLHFIKKIVEDDGLWRISRRKGSSEIGVSRIGDGGVAKILLPEFVQWRISFI